MIKLAHGWNIRDFDHSAFNLWAGFSDFPHFGSSKAVLKLVWLFMLLLEILVFSEYYVVFSDACTAFLIQGISSKCPSFKSLTSPYPLWLEQDQIIFLLHKVFISPINLLCRLKNTNFLSLSSEIIHSRSYYSFLDCLWSPPVFQTISPLWL